jgi:hypothetical protein
VIALFPRRAWLADDLAARPDEWRRIVLVLQKAVRALGAHDVPALRCECCEPAVPAHFATPIRSSAIT